ncbi:HRSL1 enzyme, partial [Regulus satrapa]|nr:HRSL1 enzyme [Regulus satrapa]
LIEIKRSVFYQHWAIYVGEGYIIHVTNVGKACAACLGAQQVDVFLSFSYGTGNAMVKKELLDDVAKPEAWEVNNKYDRDHTPLPVEQIIQNAENLVGTEFRYNLLLNNCEQLVTLLRYDEKISDQVGDT